MGYKAQNSWRPIQSDILTKAGRACFAVGTLFSLATPKELLIDLYSEKANSLCKCAGIFEGMAYWEIFVGEMRYRFSSENNRIITNIIFGKSGCRLTGLKTFWKKMKPMDKLELDLFDLESFPFNFKTYHRLGLGYYMSQPAAKAWDKYRRQDAAGN